MSSDIKYRGLTPDEVSESRRLHGANVLTPPERVPLWRQFLDKFRDPLIIILLIAGALSIGIACYEYTCLDRGAGVFFEPAGIFMAILLATGLAFIFEVKADREFAILNRVNDDEPVQVIRSGGATSVPRRDVVTGDIVILSTGQEIPADGVLLEAVSLSVDESTLTGEPICRKSADPADADPEATFPTDHVLRGTKVMEGHGVMRVTAVGDATENGRVFEAAQIDDGVKTPLTEQLDRLGHLITVVSYVIAALIVVGCVTLYFVNRPFEWLTFITYMLQTLMVAVALIVVAVPEGLPMAITLALAYSMRRMLKTNNLVRKMHACETMGATTVICTDKTGTLTQNRMQVADTDFAADIPEDIIREGMAFNSTAMLDTSDPSAVSVVGNPTEGALLLWLAARGCDVEGLRASAMRVAELPFSTERKYMATAVRCADGHVRLYVKGAPEIVAGMCDGLDADARRHIDSLLRGYQDKAMRTLGFAYRDYRDGELPALDGAGPLHGLTFVGIVAIADPVRVDVADAVREVTGAGIGVKIVTGDTPGTAREIGRQIGLWDDSRDGDRNIITGDEFARLSDSELRERAGDLRIIARARPLDKKRLVEALRDRGEVVAVTGDGTNDAPALKAAHVGLSMGDGTAVAKEASDITIVDNSFSSIGRAVMWGRSLYLNIRRFILFQLTVNVTACLVVLFGAMMDMESPLTVTQMLWVNLIMDTFAAMALASLPPSESVMRDRPRSRTAFIISRPMWRQIIGVGVLFFGLLMGLLFFFRHADVHSLLHPGPVMAQAGVITGYELSLFFTIFVFMQFWNMFNARAFATGRSALDLRDCGGFLLIAAVILGGQLLIVTFGGDFFNVEPLRLSDWVVIIAGTSLVLWIGELSRLLHRR